MSTVTMQDLELETAELLPSRETLNAFSRSHTHVTNVTGSFNGNGDGNGFFTFGSGNLDGDLNGNTVIFPF